MISVSRAVRVRVSSVTFACVSPTFVVAWLSDVSVVAIFSFACESCTLSSPLFVSDSRGKGQLLRAIRCRRHLRRARDEPTGVWYSATWLSIAASIIDST